MKKSIFLIILVIHFSTFSSMSDDMTLFDCSMPIILKPILEEIHGKISTNENKTPWQHFKCPHATYYFEVMSDKPKDVTVDCDRIMKVSYKCPSSHVFLMFIMDGLVVRLEHIEPTGKKHVYKQIIIDKLDKLFFADEKYTQLSKECILSIYKKECLWLLLPDGRYQVEFDVAVAISMMKLDFFGEISLPREQLIYKFCFWDRFTKNASMLYTGEKRSTKLKKFPFHVITRTNGNTIEDCLLSSGSVHDKLTDTGFDAQFHKNLGIKFYSSNEKENFGDAIIWDEKGKEDKRLTSKQFEDMVIKSFAPAPRQ